MTALRPGAGDTQVEVKVDTPKTWSAETPELYKAEFTLADASGKVLHKETRNSASVLSRSVKATVFISTVRKSTSVVSTVTASVLKAAVLSADR